MKTLWLKTRRGELPREQCELAGDTPLPCCFEIGRYADWRPEGSSDEDRLQISFDGVWWRARLLSGDLNANGLQIIGELALYAPMVIRLGNAHFFVDDVRDSTATTTTAATLSLKRSESSPPNVERPRNSAPPNAP